MTRPTRRLLTPAALLPIALGMCLAAAPAIASESGTSFYLLGSGGPGNAILPPVRGVYFDNSFYFYDGSAAGNRQFVIGGNVVAGLDATVAADFPTVLWVPSTDVLGGTLAIGGTLPVGEPSIDVNAILTAPGGGQIGLRRSDSAFVIGDPVVTASLGWNLGGNVSVATTAQVNVPVGHYREGELANLAFHRWVVDVSTGVTWHDPSAGWDISGKAGLTFNGSNDSTDYDTGTEFHLEASIERIFSDAFSLGVQFYHFDQVTGDSGEGARLGPFKGRITGIGGTTAYNFRIGTTPVTARLRIFQEFGAQNRLEGTAAMFSLTFPLVMHLPSSAAAAPGS